MEKGHAVIGVALFGHWKFCGLENIFCGLYLGKMLRRILKSAAWKINSSSRRFQKLPPIFFIPLLLNGSGCVRGIPMG